MGTRVTAGPGRGVGLMRAGDTGSRMLGVREQLPCVARRHIGQVQWDPLHLRGGVRVGTTHQDACRGGGHGDAPAQSLSHFRCLPNSKNVEAGLGHRGAERRGLLAHGVVAEAHGEGRRSRPMPSRSQELSPSCASPAFPFLSQWPWTVTAVPERARTSVSHHGLRTVNERGGLKKPMDRPSLRNSLSTFMEVDTGERWNRKASACEAAYESCSRTQNREADGRQRPSPRVGVTR